MPLDEAASALSNANPPGGGESELVLYRSCQDIVLHLIAFLVVYIVCSHQCSIGYALCIVLQGLLSI